MKKLKKKHHQSNIYLNNNNNKSFVVFYWKSSSSFKGCKDFGCFGAVITRSLLFVIFLRIGPLTIRLHGCQAIPAEKPVHNAMILILTDLLSNKNAINN